MHLQISHNFSEVRAIAQVKKALLEARQKMASDKAMAGKVEIIKEEWERNVLTFELKLEGHKVTGTLAVAQKDFILDAKLPLMWRFFEKKIERAVKDQIKTLWH